MIRPFTVLCLLAACGSGLYLYSEKHRTALLDRDIGRVIRATEAARARTGLLRAEWALLNEPGRLQDMAGRYLALHPMAPTQFVQLADLSAHLPAPMATPPAGIADEDDAPAPAPQVAAAPAPEVMAAGAPPDPALAVRHPMMPPRPDARPDTKPGPRLLASLGGHARAPHHAALADNMDQPAHGLLAHGTPLPLAAPQPMGASVYNAMARPMRVASGRPTIVSAVPSYAPSLAPGLAPGLAQSRGYVPSALGGGSALPPPVPYGR
jgi:hypothetical protein